MDIIKSDRHRKIVKRIVLAAVILCIVFAKARGVFAEKDFFLTWEVSNCTFTNDKGEYLKFEKEDDSQFDSSMHIYKYDDYDDGTVDGNGANELIIPHSEWYRITPSDDDVIWDASFHYYGSNDVYKHRCGMVVFAEVVKKIELIKHRAIIEALEDSTMYYSYSDYLPDKTWHYAFDGSQVGGRIIFDGTGDDFVLRGATGRVNIYIANKKQDEYLAEGSCFFYGGKSKIMMKDGKLVVTNATNISSKKTKKCSGLFLRPTNKGRNLFLSWNKVKKAKSYVVYQYDAVKNEYKRVSVRKGNAKNYYNIKNADPEKGYKYKIKAKTGEDGKGKTISSSYAVWGVAAGNEKGNVTKVTTNKRKIKGKPGKSIELSATVQTKGKKPISKTIRWYSTNTKVASVSKTGKVTLKGKGRCQIRARAHNGRVSKAVEVSVR